MSGLDNNSKSKVLGARSINQKTFRGSYKNRIALAFSWRKSTHDLGTYRHSFQPLNLALLGDACHCSLINSVVLHEADLGTLKRWEV